MEGIGRTPIAHTCEPPWSCPLRTSRTMSWLRNLQISYEKRHRGLSILFKSVDNRVVTYSGQALYLRLCGLNTEGGQREVLVEFEVDVHFHDS